MAWVYIRFSHLYYFVHLRHHGYKKWVMEEKVKPHCRSHCKQRKTLPANAWKDFWYWRSGTRSSLSYGWCSFWPATLLPLLFPGLMGHMPQQPISPGAMGAAQSAPSQRRNGRHYARPEEINFPLIIGCFIFYSSAATYYTLLFCSRWCS